MVQGEVTVGFASLSASVGYDIQSSTTITTSSTADIPKHTAGVVQWAAVYKRTEVIQNYYKCPKNRKPTVENCRGISARPEYVAVATTEKYDAPIYRFKKLRR